MSGVVKLVLLVVVLVVVFGAGVGVGSVPVVPEPVPTVTVTADPVTETETVEVAPEACLAALTEAERIFGVTARFADASARALGAAQGTLNAVLSNDVNALVAAADVMETIPAEMQALNASIAGDAYQMHAAGCRSATGG